MEPKAYETFAQLEDSHFWFVARRKIFFDLLDRVVAGRVDLRVLEIGCGTGGMLGPLSRYGDVHGLDISHDCMQFCRQRGFRRMVTGSGYRLPYADNSFDLVTLFDTIEHIPDDRQVLEEARRVLRPGGQVFISTPAYQFLYSQNDRIAHHCRRYTAGSLKRVLRGAGLQIHRLTYFNTFLFPVILPVILLLKMKDRLFGLREGQHNMSFRFPRPVHSMFACFMGSERFFLRHIEFPFGHSLIALAGSAG